jgi:hypothetical protein
VNPVQGLDEMGSVKAPLEVKGVLPPDAHALACRRCYGLTYASQHESSRLTAFDRMIAARCDLTPRQIRRQKRFFCTGILYWHERAGVPVPLAEGV